jgi:hypothetical protein
MPANGVTRAAKIKAERKESLRELLRAQGHEQHIVDLIGKLKNLDIKLDSAEVQRLSKAIDSHFKLFNKYLPDDKDDQNINLGGQEDNPLYQKIERNIVKPKH